VVATLAGVRKGRVMSDITFSIELVRAFLRDGPANAHELNKARVAFEVVMEAHEALVEMLHAAIDREHDAELALSALRHPSETVEELKRTLRRLADLEEDGRPVSSAFEQVMDELIAEVRLECASGTPGAGPAGADGRLVGRPS
jgi:hypothetical protein